MSPHPKSVGASSPRALTSLTRALVALALLLAVAQPGHAQVPPPEALQIRITPDARTVIRGDLVAFTVEVVNTSNLPILRDDTTGGAALLLALPEG
ncbi:MAG TPA: hypothetical protein PK095_07755, partial [Myxococcota bacterium]|nr:hypothetical protein [Myxococcota bacterium]